MIRSILCVLLLLLPLSASAQFSMVPRAGVDYEVLERGQRWQAEKGKIEVAEVFAYWCHHCASFQPMVDAWKAKMPADVSFRYVPAAFDPEDNYARAFFAAEMAGIQTKVHHALFDAIHKNGSLPKRDATVEELGAWFAGRGFNRAKMIKLMQSKEVTAKMTIANTFAKTNRVNATPTLILNGKYVIRGRTFEANLRILDALLARERTQVKPAAQR